MREASPGRKMDQVFALNRLVLGNARRAIAQKHPDWSVNQVNVAFVLERRWLAAWRRS